MIDTHQVCTLMDYVTVWKPVQYFYHHYSLFRGIRVCCNGKLN